MNELSSQEKLDIENLLKIIRRAKFEDFQGVEALALARAYIWLESLLVPKPIVAAPAPQPEPPKPTKRRK